MGRSCSEENFPQNGQEVLRKEPSVAGENNGSQWPSEIEEMTAGLVVEEAMEQEGSSDDDAEDSDGSDDARLDAMDPIEEFEEFLNSFLC
ncbi:hypothetical protein B9Z55_007833 [Caenorhabditis nigoni]|uniref:Uncharacterized protein n=1 Tax=Caenorhabditis nigoni TaxID=1611254 RepID=A0A2G5VBF1_9PELO|nr:hypothetical protein B9Z55_007833 [Caenorhabditis nigoni]